MSWTCSVYVEPPDVKVPANSLAVSPPYEPDPVLLMEIGILPPNAALLNVTVAPLLLPFITTVTVSLLGFPS